MSQMRSPQITTSLPAAQFTAVPPSARSETALGTIHGAFERIRSTINPTDARDFNSTTIEDVRKAALAVERQLAASQSMCNLKRLDRLFAGLNHYARVIDVLCNGTPFLPWIWAPIKLILQLASDHLSAFKKIVEGYSQIAAALPRFDRLGAVFKYDPNFQEVLAVFYADIVQFHEFTYRFIKRNGWKNFFTSLWGTFQSRLTSILDDLGKHADVVDREANVKDIVESQRFRDESRAWREKISQDTERKEQEQRNAQYQSVLSWLKAYETQPTEALEISSVASPGTCGWILRDSRIASWLCSQMADPFYWINGKPGSGKTILASTVVQFAKIDKQKIVLYHFCSYLSQNTTQIGQVINNLVIQLLSHDQDLVSYVYDEYVLKRRPPIANILEQLFLFLAGNISPGQSTSVDVRIILDGLDECPDDQQQRILDILDYFIEGCQARMFCKVLVFSRNTLRLKRLLKRKKTISLDEEKTNLSFAIRVYVNQRMGELKVELEDYSIPEIEFQHAENAIVEKADGMFLWARLVLDTLSSEVFSCRDLRSAIDSFPKGLEAFYKRIVDRLEGSLNAFSVQRARRILAWLAFAYRPLKSLEIQAAISIQEKLETERTMQYLIPEAVMELCKPLIEYRRDNTVTLVHFSLQEYLESLGSGPFLNRNKALQEQATACIAELIAFRSGLLNSDGSQSNDKLLQIIRGFHGLHLYTAEFWIETLLFCAELHRGLDSKELIPLRSGLDKLEKLFSITTDLSTADTGDKKGSGNTDSRIVHLSYHNGAYKLVQAELIFRHSAMNQSVKSLPGDTLQRNLTPLTRLFDVYQSAIRYLLSLQKFPGAPDIEFRTFKRNHVMMAYTCRQPMCKRQFDSEQSRNKHENDHVQRIYCTAQDCKYHLPFSSVNALKGHMQKFHNKSDPKMVKRTLRRPEQQAQSKAKASILLSADHSAVVTPINSLVATSSLQTETNASLNSFNKEKYDDKYDYVNYWDALEFARPQPSSRKNSWSSMAAVYEDEIGEIKGLLRWDNGMESQMVESAEGHANPSPQSHGQGAMPATPNDSSSAPRSIPETNGYEIQGFDIGLQSKDGAVNPFSTTHPSTVGSKINVRNPIPPLESTAATSELADPESFELENMIEINNLALNLYDIYTKKIRKG